MVMKSYQSFEMRHSAVHFQDCAHVGVALELRELPVEGGKVGGACFAVFQVWR